MLVVVALMDLGVLLTVVKVLVDLVLVAAALAVELVHRGALVVELEAAVVHLFGIVILVDI
jgi:hypothetical protein